MRNALGLHPASESSSESDRPPTPKIKGGRYWRRWMEGYKSGIGNTSKVYGKDAIEKEWLPLTKKTLKSDYKFNKKTFGLYHAQGSMAYARGHIKGMEDFVRGRKPIVEGE